MDDGLSNIFILPSTCTHHFQTHPFATAATYVWNYEVSAFNKWVRKASLTGTLLPAIRWAVHTIQ